MISPQMFRKKPVKIKAIQSIDANSDEAILSWLGEHGCKTDILDNLKIGINTLEGILAVDRGDWVIQGIQGEFYPCKPEIFEATYEAVDG